MAGGFLTGKVTFASPGSTALERTRWEGESTMAFYPRLFDQPAMHDAIRHLKAVGEAADPPVSPHEAALRWIMHHSALQAGDGIIIGAKRVDQLVSNVADARKGPLGHEVLDAVEGLWDLVKKSESPNKM